MENKELQDTARVDQLFERISTLIEQARQYVSFPSVWHFRNAIAEIVGTQRMQISMLLPTSSICPIKLCYKQK